MGRYNCEQNCKHKIGGICFHSKINLETKLWLKVVLIKIFQDRKFGYLSAPVITSYLSVKCTTTAECQVQSNAILTHNFRHHFWRKNVR